ncbi:hypothetical protein HRbin20_01665 [bacterium HR20]|nr:hypothetical protein HRbin20_01665 [bacterium HR20]
MRLCDVGFDRLASVRRCDVRNCRVLWCEHQVRRPEDCIRARGEHRDGFLRTNDGEENFCAFASADPVSLHLFCAGGPIHQVEILQEPFSICGDAYHPLAHRAAFDGVPFLAPFLNFLVCQHRAELLAPVDGHKSHIRQAVLVTPGFRIGAVVRDGELLDWPCALLLGVVPRVVDEPKHPLRPPVVARIGGVDLA